MGIAVATNALCLAVTVIVTLATTVVMAVSILTDYWELVEYSRADIEILAAENGGKIIVEEMFDGRVLRVFNESTQSSDVLVQMHGGLWSLCYDLSGRKDFLNSKFI